MVVALNKRTSDREAWVYRPVWIACGAHASRAEGRSTVALMFLSMRHEGLA